jgi:exo-1,4-beta-D-glucosaminidase
MQKNYNLIIIRQMKTLTSISVISLITGLLLLTSCSKTQPTDIKLDKNWEIQSSEIVKNSGDEISTTAFHPENWYPASVPGTLLANLVENKVYPDPFFGENLKTIPGYKTGSWISMDRKSPFYKPWWYRTSFEIPSDLTGQILKLHLNGINLKAKVWINGHLVADTNEVVGMFRRFEFGINEFVNIGKQNILAVEIFAPGRIPDLKYYIKQIEATTGWDDHNPQPPDLNAGIWRDVFISAEGPVSLRYPYVVTDLDLPSLDIAHLTVSAKLINNTSEEVKGKLIGEVEDIRFEKEVILGPNESRFIEFKPDEFSQLNINNPRIWWPHTVGTQELYNMKLSFITKGNVSSEEKIRFGIREVSTYINKEGWRGYMVNGKNILIRGGAWMTTDMFLRLTPRHYEGLIRYAREAGLNALRSEGFTIRETDEFYNLCDEYGVLVIQQFFGRNLPDEKLAVNIIEDMILRIRNHPSLIHFLGHDETFPTRTLDSSYRALIARYTPQRTYQPHSGAFEVEERFETGGTRTGTLELWSYANPSHYYTHKEDGAWGFAQSGGIGGIFAPYESMRRTVPDSSLWPVENETFSFHTVLQGLRYFQPVLEALQNRYGKADNIIEFTNKGMALNYESARGMFEAYARNKYDALGITTWKYDMAWPAVLSWQYVDWFLNVGGAYYGAKKACEPLHVQYSYDDNSIYVVNSFYKDFKNLNATAEIFNFDLTRKLLKSAMVNVGSDGKTEAFKIDFPADLSKTFFLKLNLKDSTGKEITDNFYWLSTVKDIDGTKSELDIPGGFGWNMFRAVPKSVADFKALQNLPVVEIERSLELIQDGKDMTGIVKIRNAGTHLAFMIHLALTTEKGGEEINPVYWDNNYISLFPGESKEIKVKVSRNDIGTSKPVLKVDGWNVKQ